MNILIAEDEADLRELLKYHLEKHNYTVFEASNGIEAIDIINAEKVDLAILDIMMPRMDGIELLKKIRESHFFPVIFLTSKLGELEKIKAFESGADDYLIKPFDPSDLLLRVQSNLRRTYQYGQVTSENTEAANVIRLGALTLDTEKCSLKKGDDIIPLKNKEYKLLELLMSSPGRVYTTKQIYESVWEDLYLNDANPVMVQISRIREKIEDDPKSPKYLKTIRGLGYKMEDSYE